MTIKQITSALLSKDYPKRLEDSRAIARYISDNSGEPVDEDLIEDLYFGSYAYLALVPLSSLRQGPVNNNIRSAKKEAKYLARKDTETMPPIVIANGRVVDGNHRFRVAKLKEVKSIWAYVIE